MKSLVLIATLTTLLFGCSSKSKAPEKVAVPKVDPIRSAMISYIPYFQECYKKELNGQIKTLKGEARLSFDIHRSGMVQNPRISSRSQLSSTLEKCLLNAMLSMTFPKHRPMKGISQPFNFFPRN